MAALESQVDRLHAPMRITFVLPLIELTGGIKEPLEYANQLQALGHTVTVIYPRRWPHPTEITRQNAPWSLRWQSTLRREVHYHLAQLTGRSDLNWFNLKTTLRRVPDLGETHIPDGDAVVAVDWTTAEWVNTYGPKKGSKFYLIQGYETFCGPQDRVDATWRLSLCKIVISSWLRELSEQRFGEAVAGVVIPGVDFDEFYPDNRTDNNPRRVGMRYHNLAYKAIPDGLRAFEIARRRYPDLQLVMFSTHRPNSWLPDGVEFHLRPSQAELRRIYSSCDIWLVSSHMEGAGLPGQEAMACGCALVTTDVGAVRDYSIPGVTALVSPPGDVAALATNLLRLLDDETELKRVAQAGREYVRQFTWQRAARELEVILRTGIVASSSDR